MLTPAISVLSAVEGLELGTSVLHPYVLPIAVVVLVLLFAFQQQGTATVGALFGPICVVWFCTLAAAGITGIVQAPAILHAINPAHALAFVTQHGVASFIVLGAVLLAFTGAEALYADMGHFGKQPIRRAWFALVFPALALNYLGQGALLIVRPEAVENPFYLLFSVVGALSHDRASDDGDGDRLPGHDHRHLFADQAGDAARLPAASEHSANVGA